MDFNDTPEEAAFRAQARAWLAANAQDFAAPWQADEDTTMARAKDWQARKAAAGYVGITWPKAVGGQGGTPMQQIIWAQEESRYWAPTGPFEIGLGMCIPTLFTHGTPAHMARYVAPAMRGEEIWCQLFSEPSAGSDLAGIRTRAVRAEDGSGDWIVNGQKVWTSYAHRSDFGILVVRTDPSLPKHKGLTMLFLDMHAPGVEVRPIRQMSGGSQFNEVFFTDVRIPDSQRLGAVNDGWKVSLTTLMFERLAVGGKPASAPGVKELMALARAIETETGSALDDASVRARIADVYVADEGIRFTRMRALSALSKGQIPGPDSSISKVVVAKMLQDMSAFATDLAQSAALVSGSSALPHLDALQKTYLWSAGLRIAGGTDEILRNIIAERVLGLPGDLRPDKDLPFNQSPAG
jgi:alkylation response protein AidB-like acyl-CoA dehydrogenase